MQNQESTRGTRRDNDGLHKRRDIWHYKLKIDGRWREFSTGTPKYQEAKRLYAKARRDHEDGKLLTDIARLPFQKVADQWLQGRKNTVAPKTLRTDQERLKPLLAAFRAKKLSDFTSGDIQHYQKVRLGKVSPRTVNLEAKVLRMILKSARQWARIADDYKPLRENKRGPGKALSDDEEQRLFRLAASNPDWQTAFLAALLAANTGTRNKEVRTLQIKDIDLLDGVV